MRWKELIETTSGAIAGVNSGLGSGDMKASVYNDNKTGTKKKKKIIRRSSIKEKNINSKNKR